MKTTDFGFQQVSPAEKAEKVAGVFNSVASKYDLMNDAMSLGWHRVWKRFMIDLCPVRPGHEVLDVAGGTGDIALALHQKVSPGGKVVLSDINEQMLSEARDRFLNLGQVNAIECVKADAECLPFEDERFDCVTIAFGLRNVTDKQAALASLYRVLKPGGCAVILEFSHPVSSWLGSLYDYYSFNVIPALGEWIAQDKESYQYLVESIRRFPDQNTLKQWMENAGFENVSYYNLTGGIVACHRGYKF